MVSRRSSQGAAPDADRLMAKAQQAQVALNVAALKAQFEAEKRSLASLWGEQQARFQQVKGDLFALPVTPDFSTLLLRVQNSPGIAILASEKRMTEAELALVRSQSSTNISWRLGVRHDQFSDDFAVTASIEIPLFSADRNHSEERAARAEIESQSYRREDALLKLSARLYRAWQTFQQSVAATRTLKADIIPALEAAQSQTRHAYTQGRYRYTEWLAVQNELLDAQRRRISAATTALQNQALIEQLTATPLAQEASHDH